MTVKGLLIDLDGTLVDTSALDSLRTKRQWKHCVQNLNKTEIFSGILHMLNRARAMGIGIGVVTSSVSFYAAAVLRHHNLPYDILVGYHDTTRRKPSPDPYLVGAEKLGLTTDVIIGLGDTADDAISLRAANIRAYGAGWSGSIQQHEYWEDILRDPLHIPF